MRSGRAVLVVLAAISSSAAMPVCLAESAEGQDLYTLLAQRPGHLVTQAGRAFGFRVGEERRYTMGPPESMDGEESATWSIRLVRVGDEESRAYAVFALGHERTDFVFPPGGPRRTPIPYQTEVQAVLTVNVAGFPMDLTLEFRSTGGERHTVHYSFRDGRYHKEISLGRFGANATLAIASHDSVDLSLPAGMFLFSPSGLDCYGEPELHTQIFKPMRERSGCRVDPAFANPGLLGLLAPSLWNTERGEMEVLLFTPADWGIGPWQPATLRAAGSAARPKRSISGAIISPTRFA